MKHIVTCLLLTLPTAGFAQSPSTDGMDHAKHMEQDANQQVAIVPTEVGQSAFAAIGEIVEILMQDPKTDWSKVNITALRDHLVDMNTLTTQASVDTQILDQDIIFTVDGDAASIGAIQRMVPAHSGVLTTEYHWKTEAEITDTGAQLIITTTNPKDAALLRGLGFFGIMALGSHHQPHHIAIARGQSVHSHDH